MGVWSAIKDFFSGKDDAMRIKKLAEEILRYADRYENAGDTENAILARDYAKRVAASRTLKEARDFYSQFEKVTSKYHKTDNVSRYRELPDETDINEDDCSDDS